MSVNILVDEVFCLWGSNYKYFSDRLVFVGSMLIMVANSMGYHAMEETGTSLRYYSYQKGLSLTTRYEFCLFKMSIGNHTP